MKGIGEPAPKWQTMSHRETVPPKIVGFDSVLVAGARAEWVERVREGLEGLGLPSRAAASAREFRELHSERPADLAIVALVDAPLDGLAICRAFRGTPHGQRGALVVVSGESELGEIPAALGVDDLLVVPFGIGELQARLRLLAFRRSGLGREGALRLGDAVVDVAQRTVLLGGAPVYLTYKEHELLHLLIRRRGSILTRDAILQRVWGADYFGGARTVDVHVRRLRAKLGARAARLLETVRGFGYRLRHDSPDSDASFRPRT